MRKELEDAVRSATKLATEAAAKASEKEVDADIFAGAFMNAWVFCRESTIHAPEGAYHGAILFLYHKNTSVTNIQYSELIGLIRTHIDSDAVQFSAVTDYRKKLSALIAARHYSITQPADPTQIESIAQRVTEYLRSHFAEFLYNTICFRHFYTSTVLHVPKSLPLPIAKVVANSGYIHSAGPAILVRNSEKATLTHLESSLAEFLDSQKETDFPFFLTPYAKEFFEPYEKQISVASTRNGLDGVRIRLGRHNLGQASLGEALTSLENRFQGKIVIPTGERGDYRAEREASETSGKCTIWLMVDHDVLSSSGTLNAVRSRSSYLLAYAQVVRNHSPFVTLKERKPAWFASNTAPHTLSRALLNIARETIPDPERHIVVLDPFVGTGTTLLDAAQVFPNCTAIGFDRNPISELLIRDNFNFFSLSVDKVESLYDLLDNIASRLDRWDDIKIADRHIDDCLKSPDSVAIDLPTSKTSMGYLQLALSLLISEISNTKLKNPHPAITTIVNTAFSSTCISNLEKVDFEARIVFYVVWRAIISNLFRLRNSFKALKNVLKEEVTRSANEMRSISSVLRHNTLLAEGGVIVSQGVYSPETYPDPGSFSNDLQSLASPDEIHSLVDRTVPGRRFAFLSVEESVDALAAVEDSCDVIVMDPPYGINVTEPSANELMLRLFPQSIKALRRRGILIAMLPEFNRNGGGTSFFQSYEFVTDQILEVGRRTGRIPTKLPLEEHIVNLVGVNHWYWASPHALERSVVAFQFD